MIEKLKDIKPKEKLATKLPLDRDKRDRLIDS